MTDLADAHTELVSLKGKRVAVTGGTTGIGRAIAVGNAAIPADALSEMSADALCYAVATDFTAYLLSAHAAVERLNGQGDIVLIGSMSAHVLGPGSTVYAGMKAGIAGFAEALRKELGPKGIKVALVEQGKPGADFQYPDIPAEKQRDMIHAETYIVGAFNPGMTRLPNGNLLLMVRVAEALRTPIRDGHIHAIRWDDGGYTLDPWPLEHVDTADPRK